MTARSKGEASHQTKPASKQHTTQYAPVHLILHPSPRPIGAACCYQGLLRRRSIAKWAFGPLSRLLAQSSPTSTHTLPKARQCLKFLWNGPRAKIWKKLPWFSHRARRHLEPYSRTKGETRPCGRRVIRPEASCASLTNPSKAMCVGGSNAGSLSRSTLANLVNHRITCSYARPAEHLLLSLLIVPSS